MKIPSPRPFLELVLCVFVALIFLACFSFVVFVLMVFALIETMVDRVKLWGRKRA